MKLVIFIWRQIFVAAAFVQAINLQSIILLGEKFNFVRVVELLKELQIGLMFRR